MKRASSVVAFVAVVAFTGACGPAIADISQARFVSGVSHPYAAFVAGTAWHYERARGGSVDVEVEDGSVDVNTIAATKVHTIAHDANGDVRNEKTEYVAEDDAGNVWKLGEDARDASKSWRYGKDGAEPGVLMPASFRVDGVPWRTEYDAGHAEDVCVVEKTGAKASTAGGDFDDCVVVHVTSTLDPNASALRTYCKDAGLVSEKSNDDGDLALVSRTLFAP